MREDRRVLVTDAAVALTAVLVCALLGLGGFPEWGWSMAVSAALAVRRTAPLVMLAVVTVVAGTHLALMGRVLFPGDLVTLVAVHAVAAYGPARLRHAGLALGAAGATGLLVGGAPSGGPELLLLPSALVLAASLAAWSLGIVARQQRSAVVAAEHRRELAEQDGAMRARLAVHEERTRISREMHDIIAHSLASIVAQAEGGRVAARADAAVAGPLFDRIASSGREALTDVKRLLAAVDAEDRATPARGLGDLGPLFAGVRAAGLDLATEVVGEPSVLPPGMDLAAYRVVQESLTNVLKHAYLPRARLVLAWSPNRLVVSVTSPLVPGGAAAPDRAAAPMTEGRGLTGIRQRCSLFGGDCTIDAGTDLVVTTTWPLRRDGGPA